MPAPKHPTMLKCQHCGNLVQSQKWGVHERTCLHDPAVMEVVRRFVDDGNGRAIMRREYERLEETPVSGDFIYRTFGSWDAATDAMGLKRAPKTARRLDMLNGPLTDEERHCCARRYELEAAPYISERKNR